MCLLAIQDGNNGVCDKLADAVERARIVLW